MPKLWPFYCIFGTYHLFSGFFIPATDYISHVRGQRSFVDLSETVQEHLTGALNSDHGKVQSPVLVAVPPQNKPVPNCYTLSR